MLQLLPDWSANYLPLILFAIWAGLEAHRSGSWRSGLWGWLGVATALASPVLSRLFTLADDIETARLLWHTGLCGVLFMYGLILTARLQAAGLPAYLGIVVLGVATGIPCATAVAYALDWHTVGQFRHFITLALLLAIAGTVVGIFATLPRDDLFGRGVWATRCGGEIFAIVEFAVPALLVREDQAWLAEQWGTGVSKFLTERAAAGWSADAPLIVTSVFLVWMILRYVRKPAPTSR